jgi:hypothetical protein
MSNLLPEKVQQRIRSEYRARFIMTGSSLAMVGAVFVLLALSPSFSVLFVTRPAAIERASLVVQSKQDSLDIARAQSIATQIAPVVSTSSVSGVILEALEKKPNGVHIDTINYTPGSISTVTIGGIGETRADIDQYRNALLKVSRFSSVNLPVGDLVGGKGGRFNVTLSGKF